MATCKYTFTGADGKSTTIEGIPALKEFLLEGGLAQYLPARATELAEIGGEAPALSRREQKNAAASRVSNVSSDRFKRTDELQQAVTDLQEGKITQDEYNAMVDDLRPVYPYEKVPALTTPADAKYALANGRGQSPEKAAKYGLPSDTLAKGDFAQLRLDIPSYQEHDSWVVSVHTPKSTNREVQAAYDAGAVIGYESVAAMTDVTFGMNQKAATKIAQGTSKGTIATMLGKWKPISNQAAKVRADAAIKDPAWTQVGMDPFRHSYFYDRDTMRPVLGADEVIQIGPLVLAKNATFSEDGKDITGAPIAFSSRQTDTPQFKKWFGDSKVVDKNGDPLVVYHGGFDDIKEFRPVAYFGGKDVANQFANENYRGWEGLEEGESPNVMPVYLSLQNPKVFTTDEEYDDYVQDTDIDVARWTKEGYDGLIYAPEGDFTDEDAYYVAFKPKQIKSAIGNTGAFDENNPDIRYSAREDSLNRLLEQKIFSDFDAAVEEYSGIKETKKGRLLDTDLARLLSPEYRADRNRAPEVHEAASAFTQRLFEKRMQEMRERPGGLVLFMAGGGGSGKSSAETLLDDVFNRANTIVDGTLSGYEKAMRNIQLALDSGQAVMIAYVYREPVDSLVGGVFKRAMDPKNGRTVALDALVKGHAGSNETVLKLQKDFADNPLFDVVAVDNSRGNGNFAVVPLEEIPVVSREGLREKFQNATDKELEAGRINQAVYNATTRGFNTGPEGRSTSQTIGDETRAVGEGRGRSQFEGPSYSVKQRELSEDAKQQQVFLQQKAEEAGYKTVDEFGDKDFDAFVLAASQWRQENPADMMFSNRQTEGWILSRDATGRFRFGAGAKAYRLVADVANNVLDRIGMKPVSPELSRALRKMKTEVEKAQDLTVDVAKNLKDLPEQERQMISDVIEGELKRGVKPPKRVLELAASMQSIMSEQTQELVRLGMLTPEAAGRWDGKYLPRFYESKIGDETKAWMKAAKSLMGRTRTMQGITGNSLKARGMFENVPVADVQDWLDEGWEVRDPTFDPLTSDVVTMWRDYTRTERDDMGEIRDAMFRFVMGYNKSQRDMALGRLYENLATSYASRVEKPGYVKVPSSTIEDTANVRRYGKLAGKWVPKEVMDQLSTFDTSMQNDLLKMYLKGLSMWKEGKTVLNPVSHANNVISNLTMAHFAGVSYWDAGKYAGAVRDLIKGDPMVDEAKEAGLFGGTFNRSELMDQLPEQLKAMAQMSESKAGMAVDRVFNAMSFFLRKPAGKAYEAEDLFFRYLIYRDARKRGVDVEDAVDWSQNFIFTYDDLPKGARLARDFALPFFSYTYKVVPVLARTALEHPERYAAPAAALYTINAFMYAMAASLGGGEDEDWWTVIRRYATDPAFREKAREMEKQERSNLPPWMKGASATLATPKAIRLGMDDVTNLPVFLDVSRIFPGGDLLDANANAGGIPLLQPITPSNPVLNTVGAMIWNKDPFFGKDIVDKNDTSAEAAAKRGKWLWQQFAPAVAIGNYHWDRALNVIANVTGQDILGYTGTGKDGLPVQPGFAAMQTLGIKARPIDLELSEQINKSQQEKLIRDLEAEIRQIKRLEGKGAITEKNADAQIELQQIKKQRLKEGLTVEGQERK
jgi:hypothetical protein